MSVELFQINAELLQIGFFLIGMVCGMVWAYLLAESV